ncbi:AAA family ATPase [Niallia endozanthoxylica]|uniref:MoxR family ATPase n=1 Tax=Niallia endozanthoxylica TaxID=2036016 RepID=A0A5J5H5W7_9BACI|nr:MoxR family ATPase [Niallia endozanthoxylica]KAA9015951.1 MoxR family ATPase [Niallia endozanthoxylica]
MTMDVMNPIVERILYNIEKVMIGKRNVAQLSLVALLAEGHVLLEDVPGVGKTMMVRALAKSVGANFKRIQFTPDLLPSDVTGVSIYNPKEMEFQFIPGPLMANIILADEINRTSPKTQSALLEAMEEASVTIDGVTHRLEKPFFVMATQNPTDYEGTYPLPEAQLDRFLLKLRMGYPDQEEEIEVLNRVQQKPPIEDVKPVISIQELRNLQNQIKHVHVDKTMKRYIVEMANQTRNHENVYMGVSPRGSIALMKAAQAYAFMCGRDYVLPDDIQLLVPAVFAHRIILKSEAKFAGILTEDLLSDMIENVAVPVQRVM